MNKATIFTIGCLAACLYFVFKLETMAIIITASLLVMIINREVTADLQSQINILKEEMLEIRITEEMKGVDLVEEHKKIKNRFQSPTRMIRLIDCLAKAHHG